MEILIGIVIVIGLAWVLMRGQNKKEAGVSTEQPVVDTPVVVEEVKPAAVEPVVAEVPAKKPRKPRAPKVGTATTKKPAAKKVVAKKTTTRSKKA